MSATYDAGNIQVLKGLEAVRKRPGMYIGSTGPRGLHHLVYEVVDNSIDEAMAGYCDTVTVALEKDDIVRVEDNGRGIPVDMHPTEHVSALELVLTRLHAGGKFDKGSYKVSGGLHGVGVSCVNALSTWMEATVIRDGHIYRQKFEIGVPKTKVEEIGNSDAHGTTIRWKADKTIFTETTTYDYDVLKLRLRELAFLNKGIVIKFRDERLENPKEEILKYEGGINEFVKDLNEGKPVVPPEPIYINEEKDEVITEISIQYNNSYSENIHTFVNDINTRDGGTHLDGFKNALTYVLNKSLDANEKLKKSFEKDEKLMGEDVRSGLTAVISMKVPEPEFEGQTKEKLGNTEVRTIVDQIVKEKLTIFFEQNPDVLESILKKAMDEAKARIAARKAKDNARKKSMSDGFGLPEKLADCSLKNPEMCEVYIVEGDSAGGSAKKGRDPKTQAILPLWGKMLNVEKVRPEKVMNNDKLEPVIASLGTGFGKDFNIEKLRYHKIIIMADADVDGSHIRTLLLTFFFRYMPQIIEKGYVYLAMPPLFKVQLGKKEPVYCYSDAERDSALEALGEQRDKADVQRYKGLGEMDGKQLWETTMDPARRKMRVVTIPDAIAADKIFSVCMGEEVEPRRRFIEENSSYANLDI
ncbi:DNA topoisomerase (ATP-hydrolyzing) subunit B [Treponema porcinum]|uniref:DNA topoisomerase (ATP-hydrolyzing) subunit B n=2 Tax=Treponema TaxID=157 RepID=UPI002356E4F2|nr:DNA topoisomerase (ATP-hydrolyzing) subunit B [Treponema porcinum]MDY4153199.1 DNA topoisomerase (ATP-hydrolyzing) subunit B [Treponema sp.]MCI6179988.1 DNA topoisomerase (ATP-hydrolyzing) subunit B [Treponema porcinum]MCI6322285.1 DNA topoisomerase (ATP-hydrolyzing) subunit B [Treponema porcinum]MCI6721477.1 DNA topoisomerase (ATP-hydrolyzing) subunit B [Treponema porcinum]MCI6815820.1 DNA topoisomerase (ATP-hydrolyzing) subunit B [Treponema porcinum]